MNETELQAQLNRIEAKVERIIEHLSESKESMERVKAQVKSNPVLRNLFGGML